MLAWVAKLNPDVASGIVKANNLTHWLSQHVTLENCGPMGNVEIIFTKLQKSLKCLFFYNNI
jgi:hypothetical protein